MFFVVVFFFHFYKQKEVLRPWMTTNLQIKTPHFKGNKNHLENYCERGKNANGRVVSLGSVSIHLKTVLLKL